MSIEQKDLEILKSAVLAGNLKEIDSLTRNKEINSPAHYNIVKEAVSCGQTEAAKFIINRGWPFAENNFPKSNEILHSAIITGDIELVHLLVNRNVSTTIPDENGIPPLFKVAHLSSRDVNYSQFLDCLLFNECSKGINAKHQTRGYTLLHYAAEIGNWEIVPLLTVNRCQLNAKSRDGSTALHIAAKNGHSKVVMTLLRHGLRQSLVNQENKTPFYYAVEKGDFETFQVLLCYILQNATSKNRCFQREEHWPLVYLATAAGNTRIVELLLLNQASINYSSKETGQTALHLAVEKEDVRIVKLLLKYQAEFRTHDINGFTPFHLACIKGNLPIINLLLDTNRSNLNIESSEGLTALHFAVKEGHLKVVSVLLEKGAGCKEFGGNKKTPLSFALENTSGDSEILIILLKYIRRSEYAEHNYSLLLLNDSLIKYHTEACGDQNENSALHLAVANEDEAVVGQILKYEACLDKLNKTGHTPFDLATINGSFVIVNVFLQSRPNPRSLFIPKGDEGFTAMHFAVKEGNTDMLDVFFKAGISANLTYKTETFADTSKQSGLTPLHVAVRESNSNVILLLLINGAEIDVTGRTDFETPLFVAAEVGNAEGLAILSEFSTTRSSEWKEGYLPMCIAAYHGHQEIVKMFLDKGVNPNAYIENYLTPLHAAAQQGHENIVRLLLERGAKIDPEREIGGVVVKFMSSPLLCASYSRHSKIVQILLDQGADFNAILLAASKQKQFTTYSSALMTEKILKQGNYKDSEVGAGGSLLGYRILHFAVEASDVEVIKLLIKFGVSVNFKSANESTAIGLAVEKEDETVINLLLSAGADVLTEHRKKSILKMEVLKTNAKIARIIVQFLSSSYAHSRVIVTPLGFATEYELITCIEGLLQTRANVHIKHKEKSLLNIALEKKNCLIAKLFLKHGFDVNRKDSYSSALYLAVTHELSDIVKLLLDAGIDKKIPSYKNCNSLNLAVEKQNANIVEMFLERGLTDSNSDYDSPFRLALQKSTPQIVQKFLHYGALTDTKNERGECPIFYAVKGNNLEVVEFLLKSGVSANTISNKGETLLHFAMNIYGVREKVFQTLVDYGVDLNALSKYGLSPLNRIMKKSFQCSERCYTDEKNVLLKILLSNGMNPNQLDPDNRSTMLELAIVSGNVNRVQLFVSNGADINCLNKQNECPLNVAVHTALSCLAGFVDRYRYLNYATNLSTELDNLKCDQFWIKNIGTYSKSLKILPFREIVRLLVQEIARRQAAKENLIPENQILIYSEYIKTYYERCIKEINLMKSTEISKGISYFKILIATFNDLANYARNIHVQRIPSSVTKVNELFPEYGVILINRVVVGRDRRLLLDSCYHLLKEFLQYNFPFLIVEHILSFLTNRDLRSLQLSKELCKN